MLKRNKQRRLCRDCGEKYAQEMDKCRRCQKRRIDGLPPLKPSGVVRSGADDGSAR